MLDSRLIRLVSLPGLVVGVCAASQAPDQKDRLLQRAQAGDAEAQCQLGIQLGEGKVRKADPVESVKWLRLAANQGHTDACFELGMCYAEGKGVAANPATAVEWFMKAASKGHREALCNMGMAYHEGRGIPKDLAKSRDCFLNAALQGNATAMLCMGLAWQSGEGGQQDDIEAFQWFLNAVAVGETTAKSKAKEWVTYYRAKGFKPNPVENGEGLVHGAGYAFLVKAPKGWVMDRSFHAGGGIFATIYQAGKSFGQSPITVDMLAREKPETASRDEAGKPAEPQDRVRQEGAQDGWKHLKTADGRKATIYPASDGTGSLVNLVAEIESADAILGMAMVVRDRKDLPQGELLLEQIIQLSH